MSIEELTKIVDGTILRNNASSIDSIENACASDLMSDVLTLSTNKLLLITGLANLQTIRTAEMAEIKCILFVRNKQPNQLMLDLAQQEGITIIQTVKSMFAACGLLCEAGLKPVY